MQFLSPHTFISYCILLCIVRFDTWLLINEYIMYNVFFELVTVRDGLWSRSDVHSTRSDVCGAPPPFSKISGSASAPKRRRFSFPVKISATSVHGRWATEGRSTTRQDMHQHQVTNGQSITQAVARQPMYGCGDYSTKTRQSTREKSPKCVTKWYEYVCITTNQPNTKSSPNT